MGKHERRMNRQRHSLISHGLGLCGEEGGGRPGIIVAVCISTSIVVNSQRWLGCLCRLMKLRKFRLVVLVAAAALRASSSFRYCSFHYSSDRALMEDAKMGGEKIKVVGKIERRFPPRFDRCPKHIHFQCPVGQSVSQSVGRSVSDCCAQQYVYPPTSYVDVVATRDDALPDRLMT